MAAQSDGTAREYLRYNPQTIPEVYGNLLIVSCGDTALLDPDANAVGEIMAATRAPWGFVKTFAGGSSAFTSKTGDFPPETLDLVTFAEITRVAVARGAFVAVVDLAHLYCAGLGFTDQLEVIMESQVRALEVYRLRLPGLPVYPMVYDPVAGVWL